MRFLEGGGKVATNMSPKMAFARLLFFVVRFLWFAFPVGGVEGLPCTCFGGAFSACLSAFAQRGSLRFCLIGTHSGT